MDRANAGGVSAGSMPAGQNLYHAYGDSITFGYSLSDPAAQAYPALVAADKNLVLSNYALTGDEACDLATRQIFPHRDAAATSGNLVNSVLVGTNDVDAKGVGAYEGIFQSCYLAAVSWLALPSEAKVLATSRRIITSGAGYIDSANHWNSWTTAAHGASVGFPITLPADGPIYAWVRMDDNSPATYTWALDGIVIGAGRAQTSPRIATQNGTTNSLAFLRIPLVVAGSHVVTFTQTSAGMNGVSVVGIGTPTGMAARNLPRVFLGYIPYQYEDGQCSTEGYTNCRPYSELIAADAMLLTADGLKVRLFDPRLSLKPTVAEMNDNLHPNARGQQRLREALEAVW